MLWIKAFHVIAMVAWFAALFYLPRLFVYHSEARDLISLDRFKMMEHRLYYYIMMPAGIVTTVFGLWLFTYNVPYYTTAGWMHSKLGLVALLWGYHLYCGRCVKQFKANANRRSTKFYRWFNEAPTLLLIGIIMLVIIKPF